MNKLIATIALAALAFTSCIKENNIWEEMRPVQPGRQIYQMATDQDKLGHAAGQCGLAPGDAAGRSG